MRLLFDECLPKRLRRELPSHYVRTVREMGWESKKNGVLLGLMTGAGFEVLLTVDQGLRHQQNLAKFGVAIVIMLAPSNRLPDLIPFAPAVEAALLSIQPGDAVEIHP